MSINHINNNPNVSFIKKKLLAIKTQLRKQTSDSSHLSTYIYDSQNKEGLTTGPLKTFSAKPMKSSAEVQVKKRDQEKAKDSHSKNTEPLLQTNQENLKGFSEIYSRMQRLVAGKLDVSLGKAIKKDKKIFYRTPRQGKLKVFEQDGSLGSGSFKKVYLVTQLFTTTPKILAYANTKKSSKEANMGMRKEFEIGKSLYDSYKSNIPKEEAASIPFLKHYSLVELSKDSKKVGMLMEAGDKDLFSVKDSLSEQQKKNITREVLQGVAFMHQKGMVHRDLKPNNILLKQDFKQQYHAKITDFGLSCSVDEFQNGPFAGTIGYFPPEYFDDHVRDKEMDANKFDSWALGVTLYELYIGEPPSFFRTIAEYQTDKTKGKSVIDAMKRFAAAFNFLAEDAPDDIKNLIANLMNLNFLDRWTAEQALEAFNEQISEESPQAHGLIDKLLEFFNGFFKLKERVTS